MSKIRILPEQLANQIAAGEVVERPASVVKELVENSIDAGASRMEVEIEGGGTRLIRVIDNGEGMDEDDLLLSLERHGTSKIDSAEDLGAIATLGFRGEAIPSIGSVSKLTITSRPTGADLGTRIVLHYGKLLKVHEVGCGVGTTFEVRNLFGNTPARKKFLRTMRTEIGHIDTVIKNYSLCSPDTTFILRINSKETIHFDATLSLEQRLRTILRYQGPFITIDCPATPPLGYELRGFLIPPEQPNSSTGKLRIMVNGRAIKDRMVSHGVAEGLRGFLMKGKNPCGLILLTLPETEIDVNVHPAKHEVRFRHSQEVHAFLGSAIGRAMQEYQQTLKNQIFAVRADIEPSPIPDSPERISASPCKPSIGEKESTTRVSSEISLPVTMECEADQKITKISPVFQTYQSLLVKTPPRQQNRASNHQQQPVIGQKNGHDLFVIGQFDNLYIFCQNNDGLVVIDQHAAHERLLYEKLKKQYLSGSIVRQNLMFPATMELSIFHTQLVEKNGDKIDKMGFSLREFGGNTFILSAVPALAGNTNPQELFLDIISQFGTEQKGDGGGFLDNILATMACKAAVKAGTELSEPEINKLLDEMVKANLFSHCPHGRPVVKFFTEAELKKWFYRT